MSTTDEQRHSAPPPPPPSGSTSAATRNSMRTTPNRVSTGAPGERTADAVDVSAIEIEGRQRRLQRGDVRGGRRGRRRHDECDRDQRRPYSGGSAHSSILGNPSRDRKRAQ